MKKLKIGLLGKIIIAIALGVGLGLAAPAWMVRLFLTFNGIFSQFLGFAIPLIILGLFVHSVQIKNGLSGTATHRKHARAPSCT